MRTALLLTLLLGAPAFAEPATTRKVVILPIQALSGDVPARAGPRVTARLASEVRAVDGLALSEPPAAPAPSDALARARAAVKEALSAREAHDFARADAALGQALDAYAEGAANLAGPAELADAFALRAAVRYATGRDEEAAVLLTDALALSPGRPLPLAATSPLFARTVERVRADLQASPRGAVRVTSVPPGVPVTLDGRPVGTAPVRVADVPPGAHLWRALLPSGDAVGGVVTVAPGREAEVTVRPAASEGPGAVLATSLAGNRLDPDSLDAASSFGRAAGADLVVLGTVSRAGAGLALDTFVLAPGDAAPRRLPRLSLDTELLDSGEPLRALVATLVSKGLETPPEPLPTVASRDPLPTPRVARAVYPTADAAPGTTRPADRGALAPNRKPLVKP